MNQRRIFLAMPVQKYYFLNYLVMMIACLTLLTLLACSPSRARNRGRIPQGKMPDDLISVMNKRLNISEEQVLQVRPIIEQECEKRRQIIENYFGQGREAMISIRTELQELQDATETKLSTILTDKQMEEYRKIRDQERQEMREKMRGRRPPRF